MSALILIAEDEPDIAAVLDAYLVREGFRTVRAGDGQVALELHLALKPDLVLLDVRMPKRTGWEVLSEIRRRGDTPVMMITALDQDVDKLQALRVGADDYVVKPFNAAEVAARAHIILRRRHGGGDNRVVRVGPLEIDTESHLAAIRTPDGDKRLSLTLTEFRILVFMARQPMRVYTRGELVDACLPGQDVLERTVDSHLSKLRKKLDAACPGQLITGIRGVGYRLEILK